MSFFSRKAVRESLSEAAIDDVGLDIVDVETDVDAALLEVENDTQEIANADIEASIMDEDAAETEARLEALDVEDEESAEDITDGEMEQIDVAQESIRGRWGFRHRSVARESLGSTKTRRVVARESLWEDLKAFFRRMREWFVEKLAQLKDRWIKFHNAGKTIQKKSKKFDGMIGKLGQKDKDSIKGSWIEKLTIAGQCKPIDAANIAIGKGEDVDKLVAAVESMIGHALVKVALAVAKTDNASDDAAKEATAKTIQEVEEAVGRNPLNDTNMPGNMVFKLVEDEAVFEKIEDADIPTDIPTPTIADLKSANTAYNRLGITLEKHLQAWRKREQERDKSIKNIKKIEDELDKSDSPENTATVTEARKLISKMRSVTSALDRVEAQMYTAVPTGLNGYLTAGIQAYKKAKS